MNLLKIRRNLSRSAEKRGIVFNLSLEEIEKLYAAKYCPITYKEFGEGMLAKTFDRIDADKGYVNGNVRVISYYANQLKNRLLETPCKQDKYFKPEMREVLFRLAEYSTVKTVKPPTKSRKIFVSLNLAAILLFSIMLFA